jgi:dynactin complex subunit
MVEVQVKDVLQEQKPANWDEVIWRRVFLKGHFGTIRYYGKIFNNPKAGDSDWLGIEWDTEGAGKHQGMVDGIRYFDPIYQDFNPEIQAGTSKCCSFIRYGKITIGDVSIAKCLKQQYQGEEDMSEAEKQMRAEEDEISLFANAGKGGKTKKIEIVGID